uniref:Uncharacterized protein n=1 Tax=Anguilla anguilla TaxID=7936 RepID=A0A0E9WYC5_ANGAN
MLPFLQMWSELILFCTGKLKIQQIPVRRPIVTTALQIVQTMHTLNI